jgi:hypothetical protein
MGGDEYAVSVSEGSFFELLAESKNPRRSWLSVELGLNYAAATETRHVSVMPE